MAAALLLSLIADYDHGIRTLRRPMTFRLSRRGATNLQEHCVGTATDGHLRVVSLWESKEHADRFFTSGSSRRRSPGARSGTGPEVISVDVTRSYVREPVG